MLAGRLVVLLVVPSDVTLVDLLVALLVGSSAEKRVVATVEHLADLLDD